MTDSRVTPQAAAARAVYESWWEGCEQDESARWENLEPDDQDVIDSTRSAQAALAAAVPLLCQPLQDEIDRLRTALTGLRRLHVPYSYQAGSATHGGGPQMAQSCSLCREGHWPCDQAAWIDDALAAVPVGTGNPTHDAGGTE